VPIMVGFGMPEHAEMASPIRPAAAKDVRVINELARHLVIQSGEARDCTVETTGALLSDAQTRSLPKRPTTTTTAPTSRAADTQ